jgi:hypothetical protein
MASWIVHFCHAHSSVLLLLLCGCVIASGPDGYSLRGAEKKWTRRTLEKGGKKKGHHSGKKKVALLDFFLSWSSSYFSGGVFCKGGKEERAMDVSHFRSLVLIPDF